ncbi:acyl-CoA thioesterase II [Microbacterium sp. LRZ72]|nr:acyl-CoA thioesterase II [Microbacterium sp. LRZ72]MDX2375527.1 acyl-CoA thioesterase II [Microbacterium sp. LRZ72]
MLDTLELQGGAARTTEDIFVGRSEPMPHGRVFGGQVLGQAVVAAGRTVDEDRVVHSMHGYFLRPGDASQDITFAVDRIHDGRSFSARRTQAFQDGVPIFSMIASFQNEGAGFEHAAPMPPDVPGPDDVAPDENASAPGNPFSRAMRDARPVEIRHVLPELYADPDPRPRPENAAWIRARRRFPDDPALHRAAIAYISDITIQESILRAHGVAWSSPGLKLASLDSVVWWHRAARVDEWMLYVQESPSAGGGRGLATGRLYTPDGTLIASVAQEVVVRMP